jgi:hypothetical protein
VPGSAVRAIPSLLVCSGRLCAEKRSVMCVKLRSTALPRSFVVDEKSEVLLVPVRCGECQRSQCEELESSESEPKFFGFFSRWRKGRTVPVWLVEERYVSSLLRNLSLRGKRLVVRSREAGSGSQPDLQVAEVYSTSDILFELYSGEVCRFYGQSGAEEVSDEEFDKYFLVSL